MKNTNKVKAIGRIAGIICILAIIGLSMAACDDGSGGGGGPLVGKRYASQEMVDIAPSIGYEIYIYWFRSDGTYNFADTMNSTYSVSGNTITTGFGKANYSISGNVLTITNDERGSLLMDGTFYKGR